MKKCAFIPLILTALAFVGCSNNTTKTKSAAQGFTLHHTDGRTKPSLHVLPVHDISGSNLNWSLSSEMDSTILGNLSEEGQVYVFPKEDTESCVAQLATSDLTSRLNDLVKIFHPAEFLVELEVVDHHEEIANADYKLPTHMEGDSVKVIVAKMRVRLFDLRSAKSKMILQEIVEVDHFVDRNKTSARYEVAGLSTKAYKKTPLGTAHRKLAKEVSGRIEQYIAIAKSRRNAP